MTWDAVWESIFSSRPWGKYPPEELIRFVARNFYHHPHREKVKLLEAGCGPGANLWYMAREGFSAYGVEGSATAAQLAKKRLDEECEGWRGDIRVGDIRRLPFEDATFDGVVDNVAVCCNSYDDSRMIYREMLRVTKPGGKLFAKTLAKGFYGDGTGENVGRNAWVVDKGPLEGTGYVRFTEPAEFDDLFAGWEDMEVDKVELTLEGTGNTGEKTAKYWLIQARKPERGK